MHNVSGMDSSDFSIGNEYDSIWKSIKYLYEGFVKVSEEKAHFINKYGRGLTTEYFSSKIRIIEKQLTYKKTVCAIFEKNQEKPMLIDGLLNERISKFMDKDSVYLLIEDGLNKDLYTRGLAENLGLLTRSQNIWEVLKMSMIILCQKDFMQYFDEEKGNKFPYPNLVILVLNSPKDLEHEDIKAFLRYIGSEYNQGNFILVLNNPNREECTKIKQCDDCYSAIIRCFIEETGLKIEDHIFKVSISNKLEKNKTAKLSNSFKALQKCIKNSLDPKAIEEILKENIRKLKSSLSEIGSSIKPDMLKLIISTKKLSINDNDQSSVENDALCDNTDLGDQRMLRCLKNGDNCQHEFRIQNFKRNYSVVNHSQKSQECLKRTLSFNVKKNTIEEISDDQLVSQNIKDGLTEIVDQGVKKVTGYKDFIDERIKACDEFLAIVDINRFKMNFKEKANKQSLAIKIKIEEYLNKFETILNKKDKQILYPNFVGHLILNSINTSNIKLDVEDIEKDIISSCKSAPSDRIREYLKLLQKKTVDIKAHIKTCQNKLMIFLKDLKNEEFSYKKKSQTEFGNGITRAKYEELRDCLMTEYGFINSNVSDLIAFFQIESTD